MSRPAIAAGAIRLHFEPSCRDFHWWDIDAGSGKIVAAGPTQGWLWADGRHYVHPGSAAKGERPLWTTSRQLANPDADGHVNGIILKYRIDRVELPASEGEAA